MESELTGGAGAALQTRSTTSWGTAEQADKGSATPINAVREAM